MKAFLSAVILVSTASLAAADPSSFAGKWQVHNDIAGNISEFTCTFEQNGTELAGDCVTAENTIKITGTVEEQKISWVFKSEYNGSPITLTYKGSLNEEQKIEGTVFVEEYSAEGNFTATQTK